MDGRSPIPHPAEALGHRFRFWLALAAVAGIAVSLWGLNSLSADLDHHGKSYNEFQTAGSGIGNLVQAWPRDVRATAVQAVWSDIGFAVAYGLAGVLALGLMADKVAARPRSRFRGLSSSFFAVASWLILGAAIADLLESVLLLTVLATFGTGHSVSNLGAATQTVGLVKWGLVGLTGLMLFQAAILVVPIAPVPEA